MRLKLLLTLLPFLYAQTQLFDFGGQTDDQVLKFSTDQRAVALDVPVVFLENPENEIYISSYGIVGMGNKLPDNIAPLQRLNRSAIAVYYAPTVEGNVYFRATSSDLRLLDRLTKYIHQTFADSSEFTALQGIIVTWEGMQNKEKDGPAIFQHQIALPIPIGISVLMDVIYLLMIEDVHFVSVQVSTIFFLVVSYYHLIFECNVCHKMRDIQIFRDYSPGYCCVCKSGYYGNGKECLKKGDPQRISGSFEGVINGKAIERTDLHTFITASDGNAYTAVSKIPTDLGHPFLLLNSIGSVMGWLFAEVHSPAVYNGFQLTGGLFNRTVTLHIGDRYYVTIKQQFSGRDIYHYFKASVRYFFDNYLPSYYLFILVLTGFVRSYTGMDVLVKEHGQTTTMRMTVDQQIQFNECPFRNFDKESTVSLHVKRVHVTYDGVDGIVRYGSRNYVHHVNSQVPEAAPPAGSYFDRKQHGQTQQQSSSPVQMTNDDICGTGRHVCTLPNMRCRPVEHSYRCECLPGYQASRDDSSSIGWNCQGKPSSLYPPNDMLEAIDYL
uniref:Nidogen G2 beta-barrel domain-containing protein n=1 Tax=Heterorhabditis bacteriophora TaxID=37862 RepID=A0A1I7XL50_HETBA